MKLARRLYRLALGLILLSIVAVQLIWLPAPLFKNTSIEWIEIVNILYYTSILFPLLFAGGTIVFCIQLNKNSKLMLRHVSLAISVIACALYTCYCIIQNHLLQAVAALAVTIMLSLILYIVMNKDHAFITVKRATIISIGYISILFFLLCPIQYNVIHPFFTFNMESYATIAKSNIQPNNKLQKSNIDGVLVAERPAFIVDLLYAKLLPHIELEKRTKAQLPIKEQYSRVVSQKLNSNKIAEAYAWQLYSRQPTIHTIGVRIIGIFEQAPVIDKLNVGDIIVGINKKPIATLKDLSEAMSNVQIGQPIEVDVYKKTGELQVVSVTPQASEDDKNKAFLGIYIEQAVTIEDVLEVNYKNYIAHFGGPSHGAMLTLTLLDQLHGGTLVGERHIAGTGTIEFDGTIGMVGGVKQKAYAVYRNGADVFFVPEQAYEQAKQGAPSLNIVPVKHMNDIINWLSSQ